MALYRLRLIASQSTRRGHNMPALLHDVDIVFKKATFGMGCFWSCDSLFGATIGVLRTRVGYSGGTYKNPVYRNLGDHTEVIEIDYDPKTISYEDLLKLFYDNHEYGLTTKLKRQYMSLILHHDEEQKRAAELSKKREAQERNEVLTTEIAKAGPFYPAEDYHQKYRLQGHSWLAEAIGLTPMLLQTSHLAARLNGYLVGLGGLEQFNAEVERFGLTEKMADYVRTQIHKNEGGNLSC